MASPKFIIEKTNPGETKYQGKSPEIIKKKTLKKTPFYEIASFVRKGRRNIFLHLYLIFSKEIHNEKRLSGSYAVCPVGRFRLQLAHTLLW
ncbi:MAG: hypothetical protein KAW01_02840 [Deltaproteobacteria bacterium]|nr:hypothetical protein [Deltaproteobacteria bacterium]